MNLTFQCALVWFVKPNHHSSLAKCADIAVKKKTQLIFVLFIMKNQNSPFILFAGFFGKRWKRICNVLIQIFKHVVGVSNSAWN